MLKSIENQCEKHWKVLDTDTDTDMGTDSSNIIYKKLSEAIYINEKDNVAIYIDRDLNKSEKLIYNNDKIAQITKDLYSKFEDKYDFIFLVTNNKERPKSVTYSGVAMKVKNDVKGIGASLYDHTTRYGSNGKLKSVMHFAYRKAITQGPTLHELLHYWANKFNLIIQKLHTIDWEVVVTGVELVSLGGKDRLVVIKPKLLKMKTLNIKVENQIIKFIVRNILAGMQMEGTLYHIMMLSFI